MYYQEYEVNETFTHGWCGFKAVASTLRKNVAIRQKAETKVTTWPQNSTPTIDPSRRSENINPHKKFYMNF